MLIVERKVPTYNEEILRGKFETKKESCVGRMIGFHFTLQQWFDFHKLLYIDDIRCAYTNQPFQHKTLHTNSPSIERLDSTKAYSVENCVWVTGRANNLKNLYIESTSDETELEVGDANYLARIKKIVTNPDNIREIQKPYQHLFSVDNTHSISNVEIAIAKMYSSYGEQVEGFGVEYSLTYHQYKTVLLRKKCQLTGRNLPEQLQDRVLWVVDKSQPVTKENVKITDKEVANTLDLLQGKCKLTPREMKFLGEILCK